VSPLFGNKDQKAAADAAAAAEVERLIALPVANLAADVMPAFTPGAIPGHGVHIEKIGVSRWLLKSYPRGLKSKNVQRLLEPVTEALQALEHAGLVKLEVGGGGHQSLYSVTRLGETVIAEGSARERLTPTGAS
jgi:hypothetical protein